MSGVDTPVDHYFDTRDSEHPSSKMIEALADVKQPAIPQLNQLGQQITGRLRADYGRAANLPASDQIHDPNPTNVNTVPAAADHPHRSGHTRPQPCPTANWDSGSRGGLAVKDLERGAVGAKNSKRGGTGASASTKTRTTFRERQTFQIGSDIEQALLAAIQRSQFDAERKALRKLFNPRRLNWKRLSHSPENAFVYHVKGNIPPGPPHKLLERKLTCITYRQGARFLLVRRDEEQDHLDLVLEGSKSDLTSLNGPFQSPYRVQQSEAEVEVGPVSLGVV
ncbi:hypothetical protein DFS34DRAFT_645367 [Phlyctochytrium arcticum]|nr:hypothetical protein DFS34DRAFT_645367 [Phlyctochytrium arcticum]